MIHPTHTSCKNCIFASYTNNTQTECLMYEIDKFKKHNIEVLEAYDEDKEFYVINRNKCLLYRTNQWIHAKLPFTEQIHNVKQEIAIRYHAIIFANNSIKDIHTTVSSLNNQLLKPYHVTIVRYYDSKLPPSQFIDPLNINNQTFEGWRVENILKPCTDEEIIDLIVPFVNVPIYAIFRAGFSVPPQLFYDLNNQIHEEFLQFVMLLPNSTHNGTIVSRKIHLAYQGNKDKPLKNKLLDENCPYIIPINKVFPYFPQ